MTMIDRVARAMYAEVQPEWDWNDPDAGPMRGLYRANARAALQAVREPGAAMIAAAAGHSNPARIWTAMIDAALDDGA